MPHMFAVPNHMYLAPMRYACCVTDDVRHHGPLGKLDYMLCRHYCACAIVLVAIPLHIEGGLGGWVGFLGVCVCACARTKPEAIYVH